MQRIQGVPAMFGSTCTAVDATRRWQKTISTKYF
jgi:hypothetical protein